VANRPKRKLTPPEFSQAILDAAADAAMATLKPEYRADLRFPFFRNQVRSAVARYSRIAGDLTSVDGEIDGLHGQVKALNKARQLVDGEIHNPLRFKADADKYKIVSQALADLASETESKIKRLEKFREIVVKDKGSDPARDAMSFELLKVYAMIMGKPASEVRIDKNHIRPGSPCDFIGAALEAVFGERDSPANIRTSVERGRDSTGKN